MLNQRKIDDAFVNQATNNMGYIYRDQAKQFIIAFLNKQVSYRPFDAVRQQRNTGVIISFIELRGFIQIGNNYTHQMVIGIPRNFPQGPPIFLLSVNRQLFNVNRQQQMIANQQIAWQKDERGVNYIKFNFPFITVGWKPMTSLIDVYGNIKTVINSPALLIQKKQPKKVMVEGPNSYLNINSNSSKLTQLTDNKSIQVSNSLSALQQLQQEKQRLTYLKCRNEYLLNDHLKQLQNQLTAKSKQLLTKREQISKIKAKCEQKMICDDMLTMSEKDEQKLQRMAEKEALKQAQKKMRQSLERELQKGKKYSDYKKMVKSLFSQMFQNQTRILQSISE